MRFDVLGRAAVCFAALILAGCGDDAPAAGDAPAGVQSSAGGAASAPPPQTAGAQASGARWFDAEQVARGAAIYAQNCAVCHGDNAQGTPDWRQRDASGKFPPPPLDGSAHAWHHPFRALGVQIKFGAPGGQGAMPGFADRLSDQQILDTIAWFQSKWPDEVYAGWLEIEMRSRERK